MRFSYQWLSEFVPGLATEPAELQRLITMKTAECEGIESFGAYFAQVFAARVISAEPLGKGKNRLVTIEVGAGERRQVVCGAPNVTSGMMTAWVSPGTVLGEKTIGSAVIEGVKSEGMLASAAELGINRDHSGLLVLEGAEPGQKLDGLSSDWIIEIDNKSLTHRPDLWGHAGLAREVSAITGHPLVDPVDLTVLPNASPVINVAIEDASLCPRYSALLLENVSIHSSPLWLQARLESIGINPISNVVDITNYVLAELPQPMHAFDADKLAGTTITVRRARAEEILHALNGETYRLDPADLVIADARGPIALAGVIGGTESAISESTTRVVLESANFEPTSVRLTSARHKLRTDASVRFEKSLDPENTLRGLARAVTLILNLSPGVRVPGGVTDRRAPALACSPVALPVDFVVRKLGNNIAEERIAEILQALGFAVSRSSPGLLTVTIPSWRSTKDISLKDDLVEEVGRMVGYDSIVPRPPLVASVVPPAVPRRLFLRSLRSELAAQGFTEVYNYSFLNQSDASRFDLSVADHLAVRNPIASELTHLRRSLLPGIFNNIRSNVRHFQEFRVFEIGSEIHPGTPPDLPHEVPHVCAAMYNGHQDENDFFELKRVLECLFRSARLSAVTARPYEHPTRTAAIEWLGQPIGRLFELHPSLLHEEGIEGRAFVMDIDLRVSGTVIAGRTTQYQSPRRYPTSGFDLSVVTGLQSPVAQIEDKLKLLAGSSLALIDFVRQYAGPPLAEGQKSVSYHLEVGSLDHTLTADEVTEIRNKLIDGMRQHGYELRV